MLVELTPKDDLENLPPITITNVCCTQLGHEPTKEFYKQLQMQRKEVKAMNVIMGDINARGLCLGDKIDAMAGQRMILKLNQKN